MYTILTEQEICDIRKHASKISTYKITFRAISYVSEKFQDISPAEAWNEAEKVIHELAQSDHINFSIEDIADNLLHKYLKFVIPEPKVIARTTQQAEMTRLLVLFNVLVMLAQKEKNSENHPYIDYCRKIAAILIHNPIYLKMCELLKENEENLEADLGFELETADFLKIDSLSTPAKDSSTLFDDNHRLTRLKLIYKKLKLEKDFEGGSQWFYIYKLMAENHIYEDYSYTLFMNDLEHIGVQSKHMPKTSTFARKYKQLKPDTKYPHWKVKLGGKQPPLDKGKRLAKIAFEILFN